MDATTSPAETEFIETIPELLWRSVDEGTKQAAQMLWDILMQVLSQHWFAVLSALLITFIILTLKAMMGRWGSLGSFLYNFFYFGTLFIIGLIWGPEVFVNDLFNAACAVLLYPACYIMTGMVLDKMRVRPF